MNEFIGKRRLRGGDVTTEFKCLKDSCKEGRECSLLQVHLSSIAICGRFINRTNPIPFSCKSEVGVKNILIILKTVKH